MKTDAIEIFQIIRAVLQPYTTMGFSNRANSDDVYDLWSDKNTIINNEEKVTETFFASAKVANGKTIFSHHSADSDNLIEEEINSLDDRMIKKLEDKLAISYKEFIAKEWV
jgi:hypothetical protein